jgi:hypothetical protein
MLCENPKTNVAARNSWKSLGKFKNLFLVRVIIVLTLLCHSGLDPESSVFITASRLPPGQRLYTGLRRYDDYWTFDESINFLERICKILCDYL